jgi:hypothetical protein
MKIAGVRVEHRSRVLSRTSREYYGDVELRDTQKHSQISHSHRPTETKVGSHKNTDFYEMTPCSLVGT